MVRRWTGGLVAAALVAALFAGCGDSSSGSGGDSSSGSSGDTAATTDAVEVRPLPNRPQPVDQRPDGELQIAIVGFANNPFFDDVKKGAEEANRVLEPRGAKVDWIVAGQTIDVPTVNAALQAAQAQGYNAIASFVPADGNCPTIRSVADAGITIATWNTEAACSERSGSLFFHGQDLYRAGEEAAKLMIRETGNRRCRVGIITSDFGVASLELRRNGFLKGLEGSNLTPVSKGVEAHDQADQTLSFAQDYINSTPDLCGIYATAGGPFGAATAVKSAGKSGDIKVIGFDFTEGAVNAIKDGSMTSVIGQDGFGQSYDTAIYLYNYLVARQKPEAYFLPSRADVMTRDNVDELYPARG